MSISETFTLSLTFLLISVSLATLNKLTDLIRVLSWLLEEFLNVASGTRVPLSTFLLFSSSFKFKGNIELLSIALISLGSAFISLFKFCN